MSEEQVFEQSVRGQSQPETDNVLVRDLDFNGKAKFKMDFEGGIFESEDGRQVEYSPSISITGADGYKTKLTGIQCMVLARVLADPEILESVTAWANQEMSTLNELLGKK